MKSYPQEAWRLEVPRYFLDPMLLYISEFVQGRPAELVFNLDEVGISECEDSKTKSDRSHEINRKAKHVSLIVCVSAAGETLIPYMVTSQDLMRLREALKKRRVIRDRFTRENEGKGLRNTEVFLEYIRMVFMPNLNELRSLEQFADEDAVLLMYNCPNPVAEEVSIIRLDARVRIITWPRHMTQVFQALDLCSFGVLRRRGQ
jgi:hypothetical protein